MKPRFCSYCGAQLNEDARFCHICGGTIAAPAPQPEPVPQPAPVAQPVPAPQPKKQPKPKKVRTAPVRHRRTAGIAILCGLMVFCSFLTVTLLNLRSLTSESMLEQSMKEMILNLDLTAVPAEELIPSAESGDSLAEYIAQEIEKSYVVEVQVDEDDVQEFLEETTFLPYFAEKLSEFAGDIQNDRRGTGISQRELERLLWENEDEIEDLTGIPLTDQDVANVVDKAGAQGTIGSLRAKTLKENAPAAYSAAQVVLSDVTLIVLVVLMIGMTVLIAKGYHWNIFQACGSVGTALAYGGGLFLMLILVSLALSLMYADVITYALRVVMLQGLRVASVTFGLGVVLAIVDKLSKRFLKTA
jgi:hypothetical protein